MNWSATNIENLRRVFAEGFSARDIAEPLVSFDASTSAAQALQLMRDHDFDVAGVRRQGLVVGYVEREDCRDGACADQLRAFDEAAVTSDAAPLAEVVSRLARSPRLFVRVLGAVGGIVTMSDLQKPPVRMWLFGMITLVEMRCGRLIEQLCPDESWRPFLSASRLQKAQALLEERRRRNQSLQLADCLQLSDKGQVIAKNEALRRLTRFTSRRQIEESIKALESLRNSLAHSQDIVACDWHTIVMLSEGLDALITGTDEVQQVLAARGPVASQSESEKAG